MRDELFTRYEGNPILTPEMWPYPAARVFNTGATELKNKTLLLVRVKTMEGFSHLTLARSEDGKTDWDIEKTPTLQAESELEEHVLGLEDARIVWLEENHYYVISCVSFRTDFMKNPCTVSLIATTNFSTFKRISKPLVPLAKNASLFPRKIGDKFVLIHRPSVDGQTCIAVSYSSDLIHWGMVKPILSPISGTWCGYRVGLATQPIETPKGWLIIYHGSEDIASRISYKVGLALLDLETLEVIRRSNGWVFAPTMDYEGGPNGIVFPCGAVVKDNELRMYYGANDYTVALAIARMDETLDYLMKCPEK